MPSQPAPFFNYHTLRFMVGIIALSLPFAVSLRSGVALDSISGSYHTAARNLFVGELCIVGAFLAAYNGHSLRQAVLSKIAAVGAIMIAVYPTACAAPELTRVLADYKPYCAQFESTSFPHFLGAAALFSVLAAFCFLPFQRGTKTGTVKQRRRSRIYYVCGTLMLAAMAVILVSGVFLEQELVNRYRVVYWAEAFALAAFGAAWIVSGKYISLFTDESEKTQSVK